MDVEWKLISQREEVPFGSGNLKEQGAEKSSWRVVELSWEVQVAVRELRVGNQSPGGEAASIGPGGESREKNEEKTEVGALIEKSDFVSALPQPGNFFIPVLVVCTFLEELF